MPDELSDMPESQLADLLQAAIQRKRWEARVLAVEMLNTVGLALSKSKQNSVQYVAPDEMMRRFGAKMH